MTMILLVEDNELNREVLTATKTVDLDLLQRKSSNWLGETAYE